MELIKCIYIETYLNQDISETRIAHQKPPSGGNSIGFILELLWPQFIEILKTIVRFTIYITALLNKAYRPNAHLLYIVMHYNGNIMVIMVLYNFTLLFQPLEQTLITQNPNLCGTTI